MMDEVLFDIQHILGEAEQFQIDAKTFDEQAERLNAVKCADIAIVVRCEDCKHWMKMDGSCFPHADYNDFCSNGERKDDETDRR